MSGRKGKWEHKGYIRARWGHPRKVIIRGEDSCVRWGHHEMMGTSGEGRDILKRLEYTVVVGTPGRDGDMTRKLGHYAVGTPRGNGVSGGGGDITRR